MPHHSPISRWSMPLLPGACHQRGPGFAFGTTLPLTTLPGQPRIGTTAWLLLWGTCAGEKSTHSTQASGHAGGSWTWVQVGYLEWRSQLVRRIQQQARGLRSKPLQAKTRTPHRKTAPHRPPSAPPFLNQVQPHLQTWHVYPSDQVDPCCRALGCCPQETVSCLAIRALPRLHVQRLRNRGHRKGGVACWQRQVLKRQGSLQLQQLNVNRMVGSWKALDSSWSCRLMPSPTTSLHELAKGTQNKQAWGLTTGLPSSMRGASGSSTLMVAAIITSCHSKVGMSG